MFEKLKRTLAMLMVFVMVISLMPANAFAALTDATDGSVYSPPVSFFSLFPTEGEEGAQKVDTYEFTVDGTVVASQRVVAGDELLVPASPEKTGYKFVGWYENDAQFTAFGTVSATTGTTHTLTAQFVEVCYVFFKDTAGKVVYTLETTKGSAVAAEAIANATELVNMTLDAEWCVSGWSDGTTPAESLVVSGNTYLTPSVSQGFWVLFDSDGGSYVEPQFCSGGQTFDLGTVANPTRVGYSFAGWFDGETQVTGKVTESVNLKARWEANTDTKYTVIHWLENADNTNYSFGKAETETGTTGAMTQVTKSGDYEGFTAQPIEQKTIAGDGSTIVNVYYKRNVYTVYFLKSASAQGERTCGVSEHTHSNKCYEFKLICTKWHMHGKSCYEKKLTCTKQEHKHSTDCYDYSSNVISTIVAKYGANISDKWPGGNWKKSNGKYQANINTMPLGGDTFYKYTTNKDGESSAYYYFQVLPNEVGAPGNEKRGDKEYKLDHVDTIQGTGWYVTAEDKYEITGFTYATGTENEKDYDGAKFFYNRNKYDITFINNGTTEKTVTKYYQEDISKVTYTPSNVPAGKEGYVFDGWYDNEMGEGVPYEFSGKMPAQGITVYAKWVEPKVDAVVYLTASTGDNDRIRVPYGKRITEAPDWNETLERVKQKNGGNAPDAWTYRDESGNLKIYNLSTVLYSDITIYPFYKNQNQGFSVSYSEDGSSSVVDNDVYIAQSYAAVKSPVNTADSKGKPFLYWTADDTIYYPGDKIEILGNVTLQAVYGKVQSPVSLCYHANDGSNRTDTVQNIPANSVVVVKGEIFSRTGYTFLGWAVSSNAATPDFVENDKALITAIGGNDLYAVWQVNYYKVTYQYNGFVPDTATALPGEASYKYGQPVTVADPATAPGYTFSGWDKENFTMPAEDVVISGGFTANTNTAYKVEHYQEELDGSYKLADTENLSGTTGQSATAQAKSYTGFTLDETVAGTVKTGTISGDGKLVLKLYYTRNSYTVTYSYTNTVPDASALPAGGSYKYGQPVTVAAPATAPGYTFSGWDKENFTMPAEDVVISGGFTANTNTAYKVEHYQEELDGSYKLADTENLSGTTGENATAQAKSYTGFTLDETVTGTVKTGTISGDGKLVLKLYYTRNSYTVTYSYTNTVPDASALPAGGSYKYGQPVTVADPATAPGYTFSGWDKENFTMPAEDVVISGGFTVRSDLKYVVHYYLNGTTTSIKADKVVNNAEFGVDVTETPAAVDGYTPVNPAASESFKVALTNEDIIFYYYENVTLRAKSDTKVYNGLTQSVTGFDVLRNGTAINGISFEDVTAGASGKAVNTYTADFPVSPVGKVDSSKTYIVTGTENGQLVITPISSKVIVKIYGESLDTVYDGTEKSVLGYDVTIAQDASGLFEKEAIRWTSDDSRFCVRRTNAGESVSDWTSADFGYAQGYEHYGNTFSNVEIVVVQQSRVKVARRSLTITTDSAQKVYDGTPLSTSDKVPGYTVSGSTYTTTWTAAATTGYSEAYTELYGASGTSVTYDGFADGEGISIVEYTNRTNAGTSNNVYTYVAATGTNLNNYNITDVYGALVVEPKAVTVEAIDSGKTFGDIDPELTAKVTGTLNDDQVVFRIARAPGENVATYAITVSGDENQGNYKVTFTPGEFVITRANTLTVSGTDYDELYDGDSHGAAAVPSVEGGTTVYYSTDNGTTWDTVVPSVKNVSDSKTVFVKAENANYETAFCKYTLNVKVRNVTLTSGSAERAYNGNPLTNGNVVVSGDGFVSGEEPTYNVTGSQTLVGKSDNTFTYDLEAEAGNYQITCVVGELSVTASDIPSEKTHATGTYGLGETVTFTISAMNYYDHAETVEFEEIPGVTLAKSRFENVAAGETVTTTATYTITENDILAGGFTNTVTVKIGNKVTQREDLVEVESPDAHITLKKQTVSTPRESTGYALGETIEYKITVENDGNLTMKEVVVVDELTGDSWTITSIAPGEKMDFSAEYTVTEDDILATGDDAQTGKVVNTVTATGKCDDPQNPEPTILPAEAKDSVEMPDASLYVEKNVKNQPDNGRTFDLDEIIFFTVLVRNNGNLTISGIEVNDLLADVALVSESSTISSLAPGDEVELEYSYAVKESDIRAGKIVNEVAVTGTYTGGTIEVEDAVEAPVVPAESSISVDKSISSTPANGASYGLGERITYSIVITNNGNQTITDVEVVDVLTGDRWTIETFEPGQEQTYTAYYTVTERDIEAGNVLNRVTVKGTDPNEEDVEDFDVEPAPIAPADPKVAITKTILTATPDRGYFRVGETIDYAIVVENKGNVDLSQVVVTDDLTGDSWTVERLQPGESRTFNTSYTVTANDAGTEGITNTAVVNAKDPNGKDLDPESDTTEILPVGGRYTLTVNYVFENGTTAARSVVRSLYEGATFHVDSPVLDGYTANTLFVSGAMPARNVTFTVRYSANALPPVEVEIGDETTEVPSDPTKGLDLDPETLIVVPIEPGQTPLGEMDLGDHRDCILHFILTLAAYVVYCVYISDKKKQQKRIHELTEKLAAEKNRGMESDEK